MFKLEKQKIKILSATSNPYDIDGNIGVSHRVRALMSDEIFNFYATEDLVKSCQPLQGTEVSATIVLTSPKERLRAELVGVA